MHKKDDILTFLKENKEELFTDFQLVKIGIFGSFARGEESEQSDIDLIVEFESNTENLFKKKSEIRSLIQRKFNRNVDLCREMYIKLYFKSQNLNSAIYV